jgi:hypothetical protein
VVIPSEKWRDKSTFSSWVLSPTGFRIPPGALLSNGYRDLPKTRKTAGHQLVTNPDGRGCCNDELCESEGWGSFPR